MSLCGSCCGWSITLVYVDRVVAAVSHEFMWIMLWLEYHMSLCGSCCGWSIT
jgi:hypothetical protein